MAEKTTHQKTERKLVNPFGRPYVPAKDAWDPSQAYVFRVKTMEVDHDTLVAVPVYEKIDLQAEIDACRGLCGLEYMKQQLARGLAKPEDFRAKPGEFGDTTTLPQDVHTAKKLAEMGNEDLSKLAKLIGIKDSEELTPELFEDRLKAYLAENWKQPETQEEVK